MPLRLTLAVALSALAMTLTPAVAAVADDPRGQLQHPLELDRGPAPRVLSMVGNVIRFADGRSVTFERPASKSNSLRRTGPLSAPTP